MLNNKRQSILYLDNNLQYAYNRCCKVTSNLQHLLSEIVDNHWYQGLF